MPVLAIYIALSISTQRTFNMAGRPCSEEEGRRAVKISLTSYVHLSAETYRLR